MDYPPAAVTLEGDHAILIPMTMEHRDDLISAAKDGELWKLWYTFIPTPDKMGDYIEGNLLEEKQSKAVPFVIIDKSNHKIVGVTKYLNIETQIRRLEIGGTWYAKSVQRTALNTECKLLLLKHAFESLSCVAVEFRTHWLNHPSRRAIERLGAKMDGVLRNHKIMADGSIRDTVVYSVLNTEWPAVKNNLLFKLNVRI